MNIFSRFLNKSSIFIYRLIGKDKITSTKVVPRKDLAKLGTKNGGWKIPTSSLNSNSICYCVGCGEDISFDLALINSFFCDVYGFDPTPRAIVYVKEVSKDYKKYHFESIGVWDEEDNLRFYSPKNSAHVSHSALNLQDTDEYFEAKVKRLSQIMAENNHESIDLLKLDIEGAEYKVIDSIIEDNIPIQILCVEYDEAFNPLDKDYKNRITKSVKKILSAGYEMVDADLPGNYTFLKKEK